jgi:ribosomal protein S18 acetylase RimI-like enzyme
MSSIEVSIATEATDEVVEAFSRLIPQLSTTASPPDRELIAQIISAPSNTALRAWIEDVVVDSSVRGRGVALTEEAVRIAQARGARTIDLTSRRSRQAAHRLYEKVGFAVRDTSVYRYVPTHRAEK